jgi:hypothetical protein
MAFSCAHSKTHTAPTSLLLVDQHVCNSPATAFAAAASSPATAESAVPTSYSVAPLDAPRMVIFKDPATGQIVRKIFDGGEHALGDAMRFAISRAGQPPIVTASPSSYVIASSPVSPISTTATTSRVVHVVLGATDHAIANSDLATGV